ncbi:hypothetical protein [Rathayibacter sp. VKM Ac-2805]|uniref:hypothetical protein n=1 Tax=Rathayibacter sp. VKM Ac-2805 TaxID=2609258 RepID=UPI00131FF98A|nr:hypothetical protein [Rathayibacter sp. VKM Ac-2805]QHC73219.1 hypothetical protein GSU40_05650 [Rathayibacter sp. VKM Ac-2805]
MTAISDATAGSEFSYIVNPESDVALVTLPGGVTNLVDERSRYIATLAPAWARDTSGRELATRYELEGNTLTQHVDFPSGTHFPVLIDPAWNYGFDFAANSDPGNPVLNVKNPKAPSREVQPLLETCFNCSFPISGAPAHYPRDGEILPLNASPFSFVRVDATVRKTTAAQGAMLFTAEPGHFDGEGSTISFSWYNDQDGYLHLFVYANVLGDAGGPVNAANATVAGTNWLNFWANVCNKVQKSGGGGGGGGVW